MSKGSKSKRKAAQAKRIQAKPNKFGEDLWNEKKEQKEMITRSELVPLVKTVLNEIHCIGDINRSSFSYMRDGSSYTTSNSARISYEINTQTQTLFLSLNGGTTIPINDGLYATLEKKLQPKAAIPIRYSPFQKVA